MFVTRLLSSIVLVVIALVTILTGGYVLWIVLTLVSFTAFFELSRACGIHTEGKKLNALEFVGYAGIAGYYASVLPAGGDNVSLMVILLSLMAFMFAYVFTYPRYHASQVMAAFFCAVYAPVMLSFIYLTRNLNYGVYIVWLIFISSWICDTCAYAVGMLIGKHKLTPKLSPKKSVEGAIGGIVGSALVGALYGYFIVENVVAEQEVTWIFALIGAVGAVISQVGDLAASAIKRNHGIKDYGKLIPGHGGIMDRFDSVIFTSPMIYFLAVYLINQF